MKRNMANINMCNMNMYRIDTNCGSRYAILLPCGDSIKFGFICYQLFDYCLYSN